MEYALRNRMLNTIIALKNIKRYINVLRVKSPYILVLLFFCRNITLQET